MTVVIIVLAAFAAIDGIVIAVFLRKLRQLNETWKENS